MNLSTYQLQHICATMDALSDLRGMGFLAPLVIELKDSSSEPLGSFVWNASARAYRYEPTI